MQALFPIALTLLSGAIFYCLASEQPVPLLSGLIFYGSSSENVFDINKSERSYLIQSETIETPNVYHHIKKKGYYTFVLLVNNLPGHKEVIIVFRPNMPRVPSNRDCIVFDGPDSIKQKIKLSSKTAVAECSALLILQIGEFKDEDLKNKIADLKKGFENDAAKEVLIQSLGTVVAKTDIETGTRLEKAKGKYTRLVYGQAADTDLYKVKESYFSFLFTVKFGTVDVWKNVKRLTSDEVQSEPSITVLNHPGCLFYVRIVDLTLNEIILIRRDVSGTDEGLVVHPYKPSKHEKKDTHVCQIVFFQQERELDQNEVFRMDYLIHFTT